MSQPMQLLAQAIHSTSELIQTLSQDEEYNSNEHQTRLNMYDELYSELIYAVLAESKQRVEDKKIGFVKGESS